MTIQFTKLESDTSKGDNSILEIAVSHISLLLKGNILQARASSCALI